MHLSTCINNAVEIPKVFKVLVHAYKRIINISQQVFTCPEKRHTWNKDGIIMEEELMKFLAVTQLLMKIYVFCGHLVELPQ